MQAKYLFGDIVVVEGDEIGVIVKTWEKDINLKRGNYAYEVYNRPQRCIKEYPEKEVKRYRTRHKELSDEEVEWQNI
jgi:hypothetical protein